MSSYNYYFISSFIENILINTNKSLEIDLKVLRINKNLLIIFAKKLF